MSVDPNVTGGGGMGAGDIYRIAKQYYESAKSAYEDITGGKPSKREEAVLRDAGYKYVTKGTKLERGWVDPTGRGISADEAAKRADDLKWEARARAVGEKTPAMKRRERETLERELGKIPDATPTKRPRTETPDGKRPTGRVGRIVDTATAILVGSGAADVIRSVFEDEPEPEPRPAPPPPPPREPVTLPPGAEWLPRGPFVVSPSPPSSPPLIEPPRPEPPPARTEPAAPWEPLLLPVPVYSSPVPVPAPVPAPPSAPAAMPGGAPTPTGTTPPTVPAYQQALPWLLGAGLGLLSPGGGRRRRRDPLTVDQPGLLPSLSLAAQPLPWPGSGFVGQGGSSTKTCECKPASAKRSRKRKRTVCYSGTYTERASGLRKTKRRKIPCQ